MWVYEKVLFLDAGESSALLSDPADPVLTFSDGLVKFGYKWEHDIGSDELWSSKFS